MPAVIAFTFILGFALGALSTMLVGAIQTGAKKK